MINTEWNKLKEVIVGASYSSCNINGLDRVVEETNEDLDKLQSIFENLGVKVYRPIRPEFSLEIHHPIMPRDILGFYDDKIVKAYGAVFSRIREHECYVEILKELSNYELLEMPIPNITKTEEYEIIQDHTNKIKMQQRYDKYENEILYETANIIKCNDMLLHTQTAYKDNANGKGTEKGLNWLKTKFSDKKWVEIPAGGHADGKLALLREGLLLTWREDYIPKELTNWDKIIVRDNAEFPKQFVEQRKKQYYSEYVMKYLSDWVGYASETWFDVNCISVDSNTIITVGKNLENIKQLEKFGIEVVIWDYRHRYFWDGGAHCCTQDISRKV
tara:strand:- start:5374 stop:6366 length:993 start_codon:yes stop_codon:yes gene_type:complete